MTGTEENRKKELMALFYDGREIYKDDGIIFYDEDEESNISADIICLRLCGNLKVEMIPALNELIARHLLADTAFLLLNFERLHSLLSAHLGIIWSHCQNARKNNREIAFCSFSTNVAEAFERIGLHEYLPIYQNEQQAVQELKILLKNKGKNGHRRHS